MGVVYKFDNTAKYGLSEQICEAYSLPALTQGMSVSDGKIYISCSYGDSFSAISAYDAKKSENGEITVLGQTVPLYSLCDSSLVKTLKAPPMSEEITEVGGRLYTMCESASDKYIFGKFTSAKYCYATDISVFDKK